MQGILASMPKTKTSAGKASKPRGKAKNGDDAISASLARLPQDGEDTVQKAIRFPAAWLVDLDKIAKKLSRPGLPVKRSGAIRGAMYAGIQQLLARSAKKPQRKAPPKAQAQAQAQAKEAG